MGRLMDHTEFTSVLHLKLDCHIATCSFHLHYPINVHYMYLTIVTFNMNKIKGINLRKLTSNKIAFVCVC